MYPAWAIPEYASSRTNCRCCSATRFPIVIVAIERNAKIGTQNSCWPMNATNISCSSPAKPGGLGRHGQERRDRDRRALVGVGRPELEGERGDLEREAHHDEQDRRERHRLLGRIELAERGGDRVEPRLSPGQPVDQAHPEEHHGRRQHADQEELQAALDAGHVPLAERRHQEPRRRDELQRDEQHQQVARRGHQQTAEERREQQEVVLALVVAGLVEVPARDREDDHGGHEEEDLEQDGEVVDDERATEGGAFVPEEREHGDERRRGRRGDRSASTPT